MAPRRTTGVATAGQGPRSLWRATILPLCLATALGGCTAAAPARKAELDTAPKFTEAEYGVKTSPRVTEARETKRGGGREQVGKPYKVAGKWYVPKEEPGYRASGKASWYGANFHGRLTANGEIFNQYALMAAHPTMPLPSYARVTNVRNGRSIIVRVNDRGPFAHGRVVDVSARTAEMLDFKRAGIGNVEIEYLGRARIDGHDDKFLMASFSPGQPGGAPQTGVSGTMIAMAEPSRATQADIVLAKAETVGSTLRAPVAAAVAPTTSQATTNTSVVNDLPGRVEASSEPQMPSLLGEPQQVPIPMPRPEPQTLRAAASMAPLAFAPQRLGHDRYDDAFARIAPTGGTTGAEVDARTSIERTLVVGPFRSEAAALLARERIGGFGPTRLAPSGSGGDGWQLSLVVGDDAAAAVVEGLRALGYADVVTQAAR